MNRLLSSQQLQSLPALGAASLDQISRYLHSLCARNYAAGTLRVVVSVINRFLRSLPVSRLDCVSQNLALVTAADIDSLIEISKSKGLAPSTINNTVNLLRSFFEFLREEGQMLAQPIIKHRHSVLAHTTLPKPMAEADLVSFFKAIDAVRDRLIFLLMLRCGLRISEACALTWQNLDLSQGTLLVLNGKGQVDHTAYLAPDVEQALMLGPVLNVYATLAVRLSHSGLFERKEMWKNAANYTAISGGTCGIVLREIEEGRAELTLFFDVAATEQTRFEFEEYIRSHLKRHALSESIQRQRMFICPQCKTPVGELAAIRRRELSYDSIDCNVCGHRSISLLDREERLSVVSPSRVQEMDKTADKILDEIPVYFDVFLCYNSADKSEVRRIGQLLQDRGIRPWFDEWELRPGTLWQRRLEQQISQIKTAAVFIGSQGRGPWQRQEIDAFLREFVDRDCPVIPVLLPSAPSTPDLPIFLKGMVWVDFRKHNSDAMSRLVWGITGER